MDTHNKILVIDDEPDLVQMISFQFKAKGFEVQTAGDGFQALQIVHEFKPDLIVLDVNMPRMGGIEFYSKICNTNGRPMYPVLVLTARANIQELFQDLEIDGFMIKPFEIDHLVEEAVMIIRKRSQDASTKYPTSHCGVPKVCIVESDPKLFDQLTGMFLNANYTVSPAKSGAAAIERIMKDVPDLVVVQLGLRDIPGDTVIFRLSQMSKTKDVKFILYTSREAEHDRQVMERIASKTGILTFVEYHNLEEILEVANHV